MKKLGLKDGKNAVEGCGYPKIAVIKLLREICNSGRPLTVTECKQCVKIYYDVSIGILLWSGMVKRGSRGFYPVWSEIERCQKSLYRHRLMYTEVDS